MSAAEIDLSPAYKGQPQLSHVKTHLCHLLVEMYQVLQKLK